MTFTIILLLILAYLVGSIPTAVWVGKRFYDIDVREHGSGNAGATNTFRVLGKKAGIPVLLIDILKGFSAVMLVHWQSKFIVDPELQINDIIPRTNLMLAFGFAAVIGHVFPIFAGFRGGKGIASLLGILLAIHHEAALCALGIFLLVLLITKYVSLGSMLAAVCFPFLVIIVFDKGVPALTVFSIVVSLLVIITHQKNIQRLLKRDENKTYLFKKKTKLAGFEDEEDVDEFSL
jgi:glycerol-3-phosphate acyltransferase PlsY